MIKQRTIKTNIVIEGTGLQTGNKVTLVLRSSPADTGINILRRDLPGRPISNLRSMACLPESGAPGRRTTLSSGSLEIQTTEHLLAALSGSGIDNIVIETDNVEFPGADGSAGIFLDAIKRSGIIEQDAPIRSLDVKTPIWCTSGDSLLAVFPDDHFRVSYTLFYPGIGTQFFSAIIDDETFAKELAPARTFCSEAEAAELLKKGFGKGANYDNTLVMGPDGPIKNTLRFPDEPVRHKVLDLIGDLYVASGHLRGHVVAIKSGHKLNMELVNKMKSQQGDIDGK